MISVGAKWFAKIRASNLFARRLFEQPYDDFPFPTRKIDGSRLTEMEQRLALAHSEIPPFELTQLQFGRVYMLSRDLYAVFPTFPPGAAMPDSGRFQTIFLQPPPATKSSASGSDVQLEETDGKSHTEDDDHESFIAAGWLPVEATLVGDIVNIAPGNDSGLRAFSEALAAVGHPNKLQDVMEVARAQGWDGISWIEPWNLSPLGRHFGAEVILRCYNSNCYRLPASEGSPLLRLVLTSENLVGWVREENTVAAPRKGVHFQE